jgi:hypothetical protein
MTEKPTIKKRKMQYNSWVYEYCTENENVQEDEHKYKPMYDGKDFLTCNVQVKNSKYGIKKFRTGELYDVSKFQICGAKIGTV